MPGTTPRLALPYATPDDSTDVPRDIKALAEKLDTVVAIPEAGDLRFSARTGEHGNWIKADGRTLAAGEYTPLRDALIADGSPYGATGGNPKLPDMQKRVPVGAGTGYAHGTQGGVETVALSIAQMPAHNHGGATGSGGSHAHSFSYTGGTGGYVNVVIGSTPHAYHSTVAGTTSTAAAHAHTVSSQGSGSAHTNMPPYTVGTWFIYAG